MAPNYWPQQRSLCRYPLYLEENRATAPLSHPRPLLVKRSAHLLPAECSGGMRKRAAVARAIVRDPEIILYDEPTAGLDPVMASVVNELIIDLRQKLKITAMVVTHDMASARRVGDRVGMLHDGKIIEVGTPEEILNSSNPVVRRFVEGRAEIPA